MKKTKSTILLSIISVIMAVALVFTFLRFTYDGGIKKYNSAIGAIELDYDIEGGIAYTLELRDDNYDEVGEEEIAELLFRLIICFLAAICELAEELLLL